MELSVIYKKIRRKMGAMSNLQARKKKRRTVKGNIWSLFRGALLFCLCFVLLYPLLYMLSITFRDIKDLSDLSVTWIPKNFTWVNVTDVIKAMDYPGALKRTTFISAVGSILLVISCSLAGYGFARFKFKGRNMLFAMVLFSIIVPPQTYIMPMYLHFRHFDFFGIGSVAQLITGNKISVNLLGSSLTLFLPAILGIGIKAGLYIYIFRQFFRGLPKELEDASYIDGCGFVHTFLGVMVPNAIPAYVTTFLFSFVWYWNDYLFTGMFLADNRTLPTALLMLSSLLYGSTNVIPDVNVILTRTQAACLLLVAPLVLIYVILQRYFTESIERTGVVG